MHTTPSLHPIELLAALFHFLTALVNWLSMLGL
jgi:hypothetical protein